MQLDFLTELFCEAKKQGIHTCLDTSGIMYRKERQQEFEKLFEVLDLVLLDFKHSNEADHKNLTGLSQKHVLEFAEALEKAEVPMVVRHVVVPWPDLKISGGWKFFLIIPWEKLSTKKWGFLTLWKI